MASKNAIYCSNETSSLLYLAKSEHASSKLPLLVHSYRRVKTSSDDWPWESMNSPAKIRYESFIYRSRMRRLVASQSGGIEEPSTLNGKNDVWPMSGSRSVITLP